MQPDQIEGFEVPLHLSLTQPILMMGVPRTFAIINSTLTMVVGMGLKLWWLGFPVGILIHLAAVIMTKRDPLWFDIFRQHLRQPSYLES